MKADRPKDKDFLESFGITGMVIDNCVCLPKYKNWRIKQLWDKDWNQFGLFAFNLKTREFLPLNTQKHFLALDILKEKISTNEN